MPAVGIREVAQHAGVSIGTVSNVLNRPQVVSAKTLERVTASMQELGFVRNNLARQLKMGSGTTVGLVVLSLANPFFADLAEACEVVAEERGYTVVLGSSDQQPERQARYLDLFEEQRVAGMLIAPVAGMTEQMRHLRRRGMPHVLFDAHPDDSAEDFCSVSLDGEAGGYLALRHLHERGKRRISFVGGPPHQVADRWAGARRAQQEFPDIVLNRVDTLEQTVEAGHAIGERILAAPRPEHPEGVFAANDLLALGILQSLLVAPYVRIPEDIAIIGYDDIEFAASAALPLSTLGQPAPLLAQRGIDLLLDELSNREQHRHQRVRLEPELIIRATTSGTQPNRV